MRAAPYYEIGYAGAVQRAWIMVLFGACWRSSPAPRSTPVESRPHADATDVATETGSAATPPAPVDDLPPGPPRAPLDGRLRIQPSGMCGGARMPDGYQPPPLAPRAGVQLSIARGATYGGPPAATVTTDADGDFTAQLPPGTYCITRGGRGPRPTQAGQYSDLACLQRNWDTCDAVASVPVKARLALDIYEPCSWAVCYHGPPPP